MQPWYNTDGNYLEDEQSIEEFSESGRFTFTNSDFGSNFSNQHPPGKIECIYNEFTKEFCCNICPYKSVVKNNITKHLRTHTGIRPFKCGFCDFTCNRKCILQVHLRIHSGEKPYCCEYCDKKFRHKSSYQRHVLIHTRGKSFQ